MAYIIDDDETRIQDIKDKISELEIQTVSEEVVARNESTRHTGIQSGDGAASNPYPLWMPIRDFGTLGNITLDVRLDRVDSHVAKMTLNGDTDFAFTLPPGANKMMQFVLDVTIDSTGGYTINLPGNVQPGSISIDNTADARTILKIQTTDGGVTYQAQNILSVGGGGFTDPLTQLLVTLTPVVLPGTVTVATNTATEFQITLDQNIEFNFTGGPAINRDQFLRFFILQDGTGGHTIDWGSKVSTPPTIGTNPNELTTVVLYSLDQGVSWVVFSSVGGGGGSTLPVSDTTPIVKGSVDATKLLRFEVDGFTAGNTRVMTPPDANALLAGLNLAQSWTALNTFRNGIQISDSVPNAHGLLQGIAATGVRLTLTAGEKFQIFDNITNILEISLSSGLDMLSHSVTNASFIESNTANRPGSGFVRMASGDEIRFRNTVNDNDLIFNTDVQTIDGQAQQVFVYTINGAEKLAVGQFDTDVKGNDIVETGDILVGSGTHDVGESGNAYNRMFADYFIPDGAAIITNRYGFSRNVNTLYVNFDNVNDNAGFGIYEQGVRRFLFQRRGTTPFINEFFIGGDPFLAGEEYAIQMGENSNASARISFVEGTGNDLILDRAGGGVNQGVQIQVAGLSAVRFLSGATKLFKPLDANTQDFINVVDIKSNGGGGATTGTIGELITADGGFNYFMRDTLAWESNANTKLTFGTGGITLETNGTNTDIDIKTLGTGSDISIRAASSGFFSLGLGVINHLQLGSGVTTFSTANIIFATGTKEIQWLDAQTAASATTPASGDSVLFLNSDNNELSVKKFGGTVVSLEGGGGVVAGVQDSALWTNHETTQFDFEVWHSNNLNGAEFTNAAFAAGNTVYVPIRVGEAVNIIEIGIQVVVAVSATVNLAIYDSYPGQNYPRTRLATTSSGLVTLGTGLRNATISTTALVPGLYWLAVHSSVNLTLGHWSKTDARSVGFIPENGTTGDIKNIRGYRTSSVVPSTADNDMIVLTANNTIAIFARFG